MFKEITLVGKNSVVYGIGQVLQRLVSFLLIPMYTSFFSTKDYGIQEILINTSTVTVTLLSLGMVSGMYRSYFMYEEEEQRKSVIKTTLVVFLILSLAAGGLLFWLSRPLSRLLLPSDDYQNLFLLTVGFIVLSNIIAVPFAVLRARGQSIRFVGLSLVQFISNIGVTIFLVAFAQRGVEGSLEGNLTGQIVVLICFLPMIWSVINARFSNKDMREMLSFGLPLVPAMLAAISLTVADRYFLRAYSTFDEVGVYSLGYKIGLMVQVLVVTPFLMSWGPVMWAASDKPYTKRFYARIFTYFMAIALYLSLALSILSPELIRLVSQRPEYWRAWQVVPLISLSYVLFGAYNQLSVGINLQKKTGYMPFIVGGAAILNLLLNFLLIPGWGMMGAAFATWLSYLFLAILVYWVSQRFYRLHYEWGRLVWLAVLYGLVYCASLLIPDLSLWPSIALKGILILICPLALFLIGFFYPEELKRAKELAGMITRKLVNLFRGLFQRNPGGQA